LASIVAFDDWAAIFRHFYELRHLQAVVAKTRAEKKLIRVVGGVKGAPLVRVDVAGFVLIGPMPDLPLEDPSEQAREQAPTKAIS
jgi:hypothetical protein